MTKKSAGLSKKIPAIFEGIPNLEDTPEPREKKSEPVRNQFISPGTLKLLFEIGEGSVKMLVIKMEAAGPKILKTHRIPVSPDPTGKFHPDLDALKQCLRLCLSDFPTSARAEARVLLAKRSIYLDLVEKPRTGSKDFKNELMWQVADKLPFPLDGAQLLYEQKGDMVQVAALEAAFIDNILAVFHEHRIRPQVVLLQPHAYEAWLAKTQTSENFLLADIGRERTTLMMFRSRQFQWMREIAFGGDHITQAMVGTLVIGEEQVKIQLQEAEMIKLSLGLPTPGLKAAAEEPKLSQLSARIRPIFEKIVKELRNSIIQFEQQFPSNKIKEIYLCGAGAQMKGIETFFTEQTGIPSIIPKMRENAGGLDLSWAPLFALSELSGSPFNFASREDIWTPRLRRVRKYFIHASLVIAACLSVFSVLGQMKIRTMENEVFVKRSKMDGLAPVARKMEEVERVMREIEARRALLAAEVGVEPHWENLLRELSLIIPPTMVMKTISYSRAPEPQFEFAGLMLKTDGEDMLLTEFLQKLNASPYFESAILKAREDSEAAGRGNVQFLIQAKVTVRP